MQFRSILTLGVALSAMAAPALAQNAQPAPGASTDEPASEDALGFDEIVVTASARPANRLDSSVSVSVLDENAVADAAPRTTAEIFRQIPGVRSEATGGDGNANIAVRGLPVASGGAKFLQLQEDGLPVLQFGDIAFGNADIFLRADQTVRSIQAVRGGSASTLASNAPGGVINFISKDGSEEGGTIIASTGLDYEEYRLDFNYGARIGPNTRFNLGGFWREGEGPRNAGYNGNSGYQIKANVTQEFDGGYIRVYAKHLNDRAIGYLPMPMLVTGSNSDPEFQSFANFDILKDTPHSAFFTSDVGLDGDNNLRTTDITDGMRPLVTAIGLEASFEVASGITVENRFRWSDVSGRFVSPFPSEIGAAAGVANTTAFLVRGPNVAATATSDYSYSGATLRYANGPQAGTAYTGLVMRTHLFNTEINDFGGFTNDFKINGDFDAIDVTAGFYHALQNIDMDWVWNSYLMEVKGDNAALLDVFDAAGNKLSQGGLYAYGVPFWGNCCQRSYDAQYTISAPYLNIGFETGPLKLDGSLRYDFVRARGNYAATLQSTGRDVNGNGVIDRNEASVFVAGNPAISPTCTDTNPNNNFSACANRTFGGVSTIDNANPSPIDYDIGYLSWSIGANYRLSADSAIFARASRGGRANADRLLFGVVRPDGSVRDEDAVDYVDQYELGFKYRGGGFGLFATAFYAKTQEQNFEATTQRFFDRTYTAKGVELEAAYRNGIFDLRAGATWTDAEISEDNISPANEGNTPRRQADLVYQITPALDFGVARVGLNIVGTTEAFAQDSNELVFPAYTQVNAFVNLRPAPNIELSLNANNLFNAVGITEAEEGSITTGANNFIRARSINGRTISASLRFDF